MSQDILTAISDAVGTEVLQWARLDLQEQKMQVTLL